MTRLVIPLCPCSSLIPQIKLIKTWNKLKCNSIKNEHNLNMIFCFKPLSLREVEVGETTATSPENLPESLDRGTKKWTEVLKNSWSVKEIRETRLVLAKSRRTRPNCGHWEEGGGRHEGPRLWGTRSRGDGVETWSGGRRMRGGHESLKSEEERCD